MTVLQFRALATLAFICGLLWGQAHAAEEPPKLPQEEERAGVRYKIDIKNAPGDVKDELKAASELQLFKKRPPATLSALYRRTASDVSRFRDVMESEGYYDATVESEISPADDPSGEAVVHITIAPGPRYKVANLALDFGEQESANLTDILGRKAFRQPLRDPRHAR